uniref:Flavin-containing monooxygenase n=1 Tax=Wuchereria bancrofti TaxID=6293 RepID=A0A1I8EWV2_WUCBA
MPERICVVGAGASGLTAKTCLENGLQVVCFEKFSDIDGLWRYKPTLSWFGFKNFYRIYLFFGRRYRDEKHDNQSRMTAFSDFVPPPEMPNFMSHPQMLAYFRSYADHFHLLQHIRLSHEVRHIERDEKYEETGRWSVTCCVIDDNTTQTEKFEGILLCCGHHTIPYWPEPFSGQDKFRGEIIHSHDYREPFSYIDKTVVLIGIGNSSGDIARATVYISIRSGTWVISRTWDKVNQSILFLSVATCRHWSTNDMKRNLICSLIMDDMIKPNVARFTEHDVIFEDGTAVCNVDAVIFGTGYSFQFPIVENGNLIPVTNNKVNLYLHIFPLQFTYNYQ